MRPNSNFGKRMQQGSLAICVMIVLSSVSTTARAQVFGATLFGTAGQPAVNLLRGNPAHLGPTIQRIQGALWGFFLDQNQTQVFGHDQPNTRRDLFPVWGRYQVDGNRVIFEALRTSTVGVGSVTTGSAYVYVTGELQPNNNGQLVLRQYVATGAGNAAVINNQEFLNSASKLYEVQAVLQPLQ